MIFLLKLCEAWRKLTDNLPDSEENMEASRTWVFYVVTQLTDCLHLCKVPLYLWNCFASYHLKKNYWALKKVINISSTFRVNRMTVNSYFIHPRFCRAYGPQSVNIYLMLACSIYKYEINTIYYLCMYPQKDVKFI